MRQNPYKVKTYPVEPVVKPTWTEPPGQGFEFPVRLQNISGKCELHSAAVFPT